MLGLVVAPPTVWNAIMKPGPKDNIEIFFTVGQAGVWVAKAAADFIPGMQHAKPALMWTGVILKAGEQVYAAIHKPDTTGAAQGTVPPCR
jgi:hypothetical protein